MRTKPGRRHVVAALALLTVALSGCGTETAPVETRLDASRPESITEDRGEPQGAKTRSGGDDDAARILRLGAAADRYTSAQLMAMPLRERARLLAACARLSWGGFYCLGFGFREERPDFRAALSPARDGETTGDLSFRDWVDRQASLPQAERLRRQRDEAVDASYGVDRARFLYEDTRRPHA